jgi:hypothetical protein
MEQAAAGVDGDSSILDLLAQNMMAENSVEMNTESIGEKIQVRDVGIGGIVFHQNQNPAMVNPRRDFFSILVGHVMRVRVLDRNVRRDDQIELRVAQGLFGRR